MRIFSSAVEAVKEVERDLFEMGTRVITRSYQDKVYADGLATLELVGYSFTLTEAGSNWSEVFQHLKYTDAAHCMAYIEDEWKNRLGILKSDPTRYRRAIWDNFLESNGEFAYTYRGRIAEPLRGQNVSQLGQVTSLHAEDPGNRQLVLPVYQPHLDNERRGGKRRVPCTMHYQVLDRGNEFYLIHNMRSCDIYTHFPIDMMVSWFMAVQLMAWMNKEGAQCPKLIMTFGSLHGFERDMKERHIF